VVNRQTLVLFLVGLAIAGAGVAAAVLSPIPTRIVGAEGITGALLRALLALSAVTLAVAQVLIARSSARAASLATNPAMRPNAALEVLWSLLPGLLIVAAAAYAIARS
jgi:heme/copper-type cytochrome/quinol oxidase subunit 2